MLLNPWKSNVHQKVQTIKSYYKVAWMENKHAQRTQIRFNMGIKYVSTNTHASKEFNYQ